MTPRSTVPFTYSDEEALVRHLIERLEQRLAGRDTSRILRILPSDHCHLGVLGPRDPHMIQPEDLEVADVAPLSEVPVEHTIAQRPAGPDVGISEEDDDQMGETSNSSAEQVSAELQGATRDSTRKPPSSLGFEIVVALGDIGSIELSVQASFSIYTQHFPTFEEQRDELGRVQPDQTVGNQLSPTRQAVSLLEAFERHRVQVPPLTLRINAHSPTQRLSDGGSVQHALDEALENAATSPTIARTITTRNAVVPVQSLVDATSFQGFLQGVSSGPPVLPPLHASLDIRSAIMPDGTVRISCYICNNTPRDIVQRYRDQYNILADCQLTASLIHGELRPVELLPVARDYQFDRNVWAVGHSASVVVAEDHRTLRTETLARFDQPRRTTNRVPRATFSDLVTNPLETLEAIRLAMIAYGETWHAEVLATNSLELSPEELNQCSADLSAFRDEENRFASGIAALGGDERLMRAFRGMNAVFQRTSRFDAWHLFQIVFIVSQLPALGIRERISSGEWPADTTRDWADVLNWADVLWFPTGGGKTEAYLGLISCAALYDRLRGKHFGVTAWLRFPLRMLSVQQLQRALRVVWETEQERISMMGEDSTSEPISLGYFVGPSTPNYLNMGKWSIDHLQNDPDLRNKLLLVSNCPACLGTKTIQVVVDRTLQRIRHVCSQCGAHLPIYLSDDEIYRFLPTVIVGTIDKMAGVAYRADFPMLWGAAVWRCPEHPEHGFGMGDWCISGCPTNPGSGRKAARRRTAVIPYDPSPAFHIQDELHLLQQELGAFAGHYETLIRSCEGQVGGRPPKTIAATATIEGFQHQIRQIYGIPNARRFPARGYDLYSSFYTSPDLVSDAPASPAKIARVYVAFRPPHLHAADAASLCVRHLHEEINRLYSNPMEAATLLPTATNEESVRALLFFYSTTLTYVGSKSRGVRIRQSLERDAGQLRPGNLRDLNTEFLSGDSTLSEIAETVRRVEDPPEWREDGHLDAAVATSIISHGVDVERFNLMVMDSIPEETADYIQASSRSGRRHVGLVIATLASYSLRASSIYHRFIEYHRHLERLISPVSVNRFAKFAALRTSPGVFAGVLLGRYGAILHNQSFTKRRTVAEFLNPNLQSQLPRQIGRQEMSESFEEAYALNQQIYPEGLELRMKRVLDEQLARLLHLIAGSRKDKLKEVLQPSPMSSLRDVDVGVRFRPDEDADFTELQWFNGENV
jgi:Helicase conserved C-terminal domain